MQIKLRRKPRYYVCPFSNVECIHMDTIGPYQSVECEECNLYNGGVRATGGLWILKIFKRKK